MVIQFYWHPGSPPARAAYMTLRALGIEHDLHFIDLLTGAQKKPEYLKINPGGKVPAIVDGDFQLSESKAIAAYLVNEYGQGLKKDLYPTDPFKRAKVDQMLYLVDPVGNATREYPALPQVIFAGIMPDESKRHILEKALKDVEGYLTQSEFVAGDNLTIADFCFYVWVSFPDLHPDGFDYSPYPKIQKWLKYIRNLPYHDVCNKPGNDMIEGMLKEKMSPTVDFYHFFLSPFSRGVHMTLKALEVPFNIKEINLLKGEQKKEEYLKINPRGKVPSVKIGDFCLSESRAIAAYLCNKLADEEHDFLYPKDATARAKVDMWLYLGETVFDAMNKWLNVSGFFFGNDLPDPDSSVFNKALQDIESRVEGKFLTGDHVTIADIFLYTPIVNAEVGALFDWSPYPKLNAVFNNIKALPYHGEVNDASFAQIKKLVAPKMDKLKKSIKKAEKKKKKK